MGWGEVTGSLQAKPMELCPPGTPWEGSVLRVQMLSPIPPSTWAPPPWPSTYKAAAGLQ